MKDEHLLVTNIQRMCFHDGPGIRTTVFLKGCPLRCPWCANPENISFQQQEYSVDGKKGVYGNFYTPEELVESVLKDEVYYGAEGGVTFSGGEPLFQAAALEKVLMLLRERGIHTTIETALQIPLEQWKNLSSLIDLFYVDIKILESGLCSKVLRGNIDDYFRNVAFLYSEKRSMIFRFPLNLEYTLTEDNVERVLDFLTGYSDIPVEIFVTHSLGEKKYESLGLKCEQWKSISEEALLETKRRIEDRGCKVSINRL